MTFFIGYGFFRPEVRDAGQQIAVPVQAKLVVFGHALSVNRLCRFIVHRIGNEEYLNIGALVFAIRLHPGNTVLGIFFKDVLPF